MNLPRIGHEEFGPVAGWYDRLMEGVPYRMWVAYYLLLLSKIGHKPKSLLDVCCGTGNVTELLVKEGFEVEGFDLSAPMIAVAREKARQSLTNTRYEVADAATFDMGRTYDSAFSFFDSLNYITVPDRLQAALVRIFNHLAIGGSLVFDMNTAYAFEQGMFTQRKLAKNAPVRYDWRGDWSAESGLIQVEMKFWANGREFCETHVQRAYPEFEMRGMLAAAGFEEVEVFHSYTLERPRKTSDRVHYVCRRLA